MWGVFAIASYGFLSAVGALFRIVLAHPIATVLFMFSVYTVQSCRYNNNMGGMDLVSVMAMNETNFEQFAGSPNSCARDEGMTTCRYDDIGSVTFSPTRVQSIVYTGMNGEPYDQSARFYERVMAMFGFPNRQPDITTLDHMVWKMPGITIEVSSDDRMNIKGVRVTRG